MKPFDERLPEEQDPHYEELIALLRQANLNPLLVDPTRRAQILSRARARLMQANPGFSLREDMSMAEMRELGSTPSTPKVRGGKQDQRGRLVHLLHVLAAVLVVAALLGSSLLLLQHRLAPTGDHATGASQTSSTATAQGIPTARATANSYASFVATNGTMFGFDAQHTNANPYERILNPRTVGGLTKQWIYQTGTIIYSSPAVAGGVVYIGSQNFNVYALDAASGVKKWAYQTHGPIFFSSTTVANGRVYAGSVDGNLYAFHLPGI
jgi:PQQ-like domain